MLALLCRAYQKNPRDFPTRRVELYERCLRGLLRDWKEEKDYHVSGVYVDAMLEFLEVAGYELFAQGHEQFTESLLREAMVPWLNSLKQAHELYGRSATDLIAELKRDGIFITGGEHQDAPLLFVHRTFHEYVTASALARRVKGEGWQAMAALVDRKAWLPAWQEVIILLAAWLPDTTRLLELLSDRKKDDYFRHRLALAALCLPELQREARRAQSKIVDQITSAAVTFWGEHRLKIYKLISSAWTEIPTWRPSGRSSARRTP